MDITELLARTRDVDAVIKTIDQKLGRAQAPLVVEQAPATDADLGEIGLELASAHETVFEKEHEVAPGKGCVTFGDSS